MKLKSIIIFSFIILSLVLAACTSIVDTNKEITITSYNWGFIVSGDDIFVGDTVMVTHKSEGGTHGMAIPGLNINTEPIKPGEVDTFEFVATKAGSYDFYCNIMCGQGHHSMRNSLVINE